MHDAPHTDAAQHLTQLRCEEQRLISYLRVYAAHVRPKDNLHCVPALQHRGITDNAACGCGVCAPWRQTREEYIAALALTPKGHKWSTCTCSICRFIGRVHLNFLAATNRRDLLIEMSYHAGQHSSYGAQVMDWFNAEMQQPFYTVAWCAQEMGRRPVVYWLQKCASAVSGIVGGPVFRDEVLCD